VAVEAFLELLTISNDRPYRIAYRAHIPGRSQMQTGLSS
jgi:hypothetical protein